MRFRDRATAGKRLAGEVTALLTELGIQIGTEIGTEIGTSGIQVLALPRGGVPVARPIADQLGIALRVLLVRKLGLPAHPELAIGAIAAIGDRITAVRNDDVLRSYGIDERTWDHIEHRERGELLRRSGRFAGFLAAEPTGSPVLLVDDGLATGATMRAAAGVVRAMGAEPVLIAVPVASPRAVELLTADGARVVWLAMPDPLVAVGEAYRDFHQLTDDEALKWLRTGK